jgi:hypothetical protein
MTLIGVGWSPKGILPFKGAYFEIKKKQNLRREINVSFKAPPNHLKNMSQMCLGFSMLNHSLKRREENAPLWEFILFC